MSWEVWAMNLRTSYFDFTLFKANMKRFCWVAALYLGAFLTIGILILIKEERLDGFVIMNTVGAVIAALLPSILFSYLNSSGAVTCMHAFPIKRKAHYITNIVSSYVLLAVPAIICYAVGFGICLPGYANIRTLFEYFLLFFVLVTIFSSGAVLGVMCTGNSIAAICFAGIFIGFPYYAEGLVKMFLENNLLGMIADDIYTIEHFSILEINPFMIGLFIVSLLLYVLSWFMYKYRRLENNGEIIVYEFLKPVFMGGVSLFCGILGYFYLSSFFGEKLIFVWPFGMVGLIISFMLSKKSLSPKGIIKPVVIYTIAFFVFMAVMKFDLTGYERRIPDIDKIESISLVGDGYQTVGNGYIRFNDAYDIVYVDDKRCVGKNPVKAEDFNFTERTDFENIINLHNYLIKCDRRGIQNYMQRLPIKYTLKNGRTLSRNYYISYLRDKEYMKPVYTTKQMVTLQHISLSEKIKVSRISVTDSRLKREDKTFYSNLIDEKKSQELWEALKKDMQNVSYDDIASYQNSITAIDVEYSIPVTDEDGKLYYDRIYKTDKFGIPDSYVNTIEILTEMGFYDSLIKPEDIAYAEVFYYNEEGAEEEITVKEDIEALYDYVSRGKRFIGQGQYIACDMNIDFYDKDNILLFKAYSINDIVDTPPQTLTLIMNKAAVRGAADNKEVVAVTQTECF